MRGDLSMRGRAGPRVRRLPVRGRPCPHAVASAHAVVVRELAAVRAGCARPYVVEGWPGGCSHASVEGARTKAACRYG